jgi:hypothetical protein
MLLTWNLFDRVNVAHHGNAPTFELGVVELTGADLADVGHNTILEDEHVDDGVLICQDDHVPHYFEGKGLAIVFIHHGNPPTLELGVVELTGVDPADVGHNMILEGEHVDDGVVVCQDDHVPHYFDGTGLARVFRHHGNAPTLELGVVELTGADPADVGHNAILEDEHVDDGVVVCQDVVGPEPPCEEPGRGVVHH